LDHAGPRPLEVLASLPPGRRVVIVPLLLTAAYHGRVDVPEIVSAAAGLPLDVRLADVLGPSSADEVPSLLVDALVRRLPSPDLDGIVLAAAGTRSAAARETITWAAEALSARLGLPCAVAYASGAPPLPGPAVAALRESPGVDRIGVSAYFLAPGHLYDLARRSASECGAVALAEPLGDAPELARLVASRVEAALAAVLPAAA